MEEGLSVLASLTARLCRSTGAHWVLIPHCILFPCGSVSFPIQDRVSPFHKDRCFPSFQAWLQGIISLAFKVLFPCAQYSYWIQTTFLISEFSARSKYNLGSGRWVDYWLVTQAIGSLHHSLQWHLIRARLYTCWRLQTLTVVMMMLIIITPFHLLIQQSCSEHLLPAR